MRVGMRIGMVLSGVFLEGGIGRSFGISWRGVALGGTISRHVVGRRLVRWIEQLPSQHRSLCRIVSRRVPGTIPGERFGTGL